MTDASLSRWEKKRTDESRQIEEVLRKGGFEQVDAYRYNRASIRVRVIDSRFERLGLDKRDEWVEPYLETLPEDIQSQIVSLYTFAPSELHPSERMTREFLQNVEFEHPSPSVL